MNLIKIMYALNSDMPTQRSTEAQNQRSVQHVGEFSPRPRPHHVRNQSNRNAGQNSPQPSNHSEITTSSNSDSGIGFHNDFTNISDRIVVVDFPSHASHSQQRIRLNSERPVPFGIGSIGTESVRNIRSTTSSHDAVNDVPKRVIFHSKSKSLDCTLNENYLAGPSRKSLPNAAVHLVRAMPDRCRPAPKMPLQENCTSMPNSPIKHQRYETIFGCTNIEKTVPDPEIDQQNDLQSDSEEVKELRNDSAMLIARSCDNLIITARAHKFPRTHQVQQFLASFDDVSLLGEAPPPPLPYRSKLKNHSNSENDNEDYIFLAPQAPPLMKRSKNKKLSGSFDKPNGSKDVTDLNKSPKIKVFGTKAHRSGKHLNKVKRKLSIDTKPETDEKLCSTRSRDFSVWGSLQDLEMLKRLDIKNSSDTWSSKRDFLEPAYSEPNLLVSRKHKKLL